MARPKGLRLSRPAVDDVLRMQRINLTDLAVRSDMPLTTLSSLYNGNHGASSRNIEKLTHGSGCHPETLFPELLFAGINKTEAAA